MIIYLQLIVADEVRVEHSGRLARILGFVLQPQTVHGTAAGEGQFIGNDDSHTPVIIQSLFATGRHTDPRPVTISQSHLSPRRATDRGKGVVQQRLGPVGFKSAQSSRIQESQSL